MSGLTKYPCKICESDKQKKGKWCVMPGLSIDDISMKYQHIILQSKIKKSPTETPECLTAQKRWEKCTIIIIGWCHFYIKHWRRKKFICPYISPILTSVVSSLWNWLFFFPLISLTSLCVQWTLSKYLSHTLISSSPLLVLTYVKRTKPFCAP